MKIKLTKEYLENKYISAEQSTIAIAKESGYSAETVRKRLITYGIPVRKHSVAQKNYIMRVLSGGINKVHPTKGRERTTEEKNKISATMRKYHQERRMYNECARNENK